MKPLEKIAIALVFAIAIIGTGGCGTTSYVSAEIGSQQYVNPPWAPPYVAGVRYYYLPDIEAYYDLSNQDFVYLDNGQWLFSRTLPPIYSWYDLYDGFTVALNVGVFQPWMHNQYYVSHYPRYYYRNKYNDNDLGRIRGFNENGAKPFYRDEGNRNFRNGARNENRQGNNPVVNNRPENSRRPDNNNQNNRPINTHPEATRPPQKVGYYGKEIGRPVKVQPHMRENTPKSSAERRGNTSKGPSSNRGRGR